MLFESNMTRLNAGRVISHTLGKQRDHGIHVAGSINQELIITKSRQ